MLSRFASLPRFSSLLSSTTYAREDVEKAVKEIKRLGKQVNNGDHTLLKQQITKMLAVMKKFSDSIQVQRVACHALSNLAMQVTVARWIMAKGGFNLIKKALIKFENDHKLCWLGSSAVWNLARPPANRSLIGKDGVKVMLRMLFLHREKEKVTNTTIGALSNLSLCDDLKDIIAAPNNVELILSVLSYYVQKKSLTVMTSGAGLLANLAVSDEHASLLVSKSALSHLLNLLEWNCEQSDDTLHRNTCAALNNMVTGEGFLDAFLHCRGVETVFAFLKSNGNRLYSNLLENCLVNIEVDASTKTTSFHLCSSHGRLSILKSLLNGYPFTDLNITDGKNMTCLDYAIMSKHADVIEFLTKCGATKYTENFEDKDAAIKRALQKGKATLNHVQKCNQKAISTSLHEFPEDICHLAVGFISDIDMLKGMNQFS